MKPKFFYSFVCLILLQTSLYSQSDIFEFRYRIGTPAITKASKLDSDLYNNFKYNRIKIKNDNSVYLNYSRILYPKLKLYLTVGLEYSVLKFNSSIVNENHLEVDVLNMSVNRIIPHIGLKKRVQFCSNKMALDFNIDLIHQFYNADQQSYVGQNLIQSDQNYTYEYNIFLNHFKGNSSVNESSFYKFKAEYGVNFNYTLWKNMQLSFGLSLSRNTTFFYDYFYRITDNKPSDYVYYIIKNLGDKSTVKTNLLFFNFGLSYSLTK